MEGGFDPSAGDVGAAEGTQSSAEVVQALVQMGISEKVAEMAVRQTGATSAEAAINWVFENSESTRAESDESFYQDLKMVFVVNTSLPMSPGKMAAQVGHGAVGLYEELVSKQDVFGASLLQWNDGGSKKIVVQGSSSDELTKLADDAKNAGLPFYAVYDAGRTQIPSGSHTVLAIFGLSDQVDKVTRHLKLL